MESCAEPEKKIYKYYAKESYNLEAFCNNQIYFSKTNVQNDPFDSTDLLIRPFEIFCNQVGYDKISSKGLQKHAVCAFTESASRQPDNKHMWALYAKYSGYALEFNRKILEEEIARAYACPIHLLKVQYECTPLNLDNNNATFTDAINKTTHSISDCISNYRQGDHRDMESLFLHLHLRKDKSVWEIEDEWRLIIGNNTNCKGHLQELQNGYLLDLPKKAITSITVGTKMPDACFDMLKKCAKHKGIEMNKARPIVDPTSLQWRIEIDPIALESNVSL
jgi:hypothetical protein